MIMNLDNYFRIIYDNGMTNIFNQLTFGWFSSLADIAKERAIKTSDMKAVSEDYSSLFLVKQWDRCSHFTPNQLLEKAARTFAAPAQTAKVTTKNLTNTPLVCNNVNSPPSTPHILSRMFWRQILMTALIKLLIDLLQLATPLVFRQLILLASLEDENLLTGIAYTLLLFICVEVRSVAVKWYFIHSLGLGLKLQALFTSLIYNKIVRRSSSKSIQSNILNVVSSDIDTVQQFSTTIHNIWSCPLQISLSLAALYYLLGCAVIPGVLITILFVPLAMFGSKFTKLWQKQQMDCKDKRVRMSTEVFSNIKSVKLFAWEPIFLSKVEQLRSKELGCVRKAALVQSLIDTLNYWAPFLVAFSSFGAYTWWLEKQLTAPVAFVALGLFNQLRSPMTAIGNLILQQSTFNVSFDRLNKLIHQDSGIDSPMNLQVNCKLDECESKSYDAI